MSTEPTQCPVCGQWLKRLKRERPGRPPGGGPTQQAVMAAADGSRTLTEVARMVGRSVAHVDNIRAAFARRGISLSFATAARTRIVDAATVVRNAAILRRAVAGEAMQAIADDYGITRERVRQIIAKAGVDVPAHHHVKHAAAVERKARALAARMERQQTRQALIARLREMVVGGMSIARAGAALGIPYSKLSGIAAAHLKGLSTHGRWNSSLDIDRDRAVRLYRSGWSMLATAATIGRSIPFVENALNKAGVARRPAGRQIKGDLHASQEE